jgi:hypothetical protein
MQENGQMTIRKLLNTSIDSEELSIFCNVIEFWMRDWIRYPEAIESVLKSPTFESIWRWSAFVNRRTITLTKSSSKDSFLLFPLLITSETVTLTRIGFHTISLCKPDTIEKVKCKQWSLIFSEKRGLNGHALNDASLFHSDLFEINGRNISKCARWNRVRYVYVIVNWRVVPELWKTW